ncbi:hypothetical protein M9434_001152 [Picochlorum sp. BPE23]|nr:hypothetical protein M9434_001152 [Picochlorum sp. BPE23]
MAHVIYTSAVLVLVQHILSSIPVTLGQDTSVISSLFPGSEPIFDEAFVPYNTSFPAFANLGGPVDLRGSLYQKESAYIGVILPSGFSSSLYLGDEQFMLQMGRYLTWECTGLPGEYRATVLRRDLYSNGTMVVSQRCEMGKIVQPNLYYWISSTEECPEVGSDFPASSETMILLNSTTIPPPDFGNLTCSAGANVTGLDTSGPAALEAEYADGLGVYQLEYASVPPPFDPSKSAVSPSSFEYPGITSVVHGIYDIQAANAFRTIAGDGFAIVQYDNDTFTQALGSYISYECLGDGVSGYRSVASQSSFGQGGPLFYQPNVAGCSAGEFLNDEVSQVRIKATIETTCPESSEGGRIQDLITRIADDSRDGDTGPLCVASAPSSAAVLYRYSFTSLLIVAIYGVFASMC